MVDPTPSQPTPNSLPGEAAISKKKFSSTARILVGLVSSYLKVENLTEDSPKMKPIKLYTALNCRTAQLRTEIINLPEVSMARDRVEAALSKLNAIASDPTAKGINAQAKDSYNVFVKQFKTPSDNVKLELEAVENLKKEFKNLVAQENEAIVKVLAQIDSAPSPKTASESPQVRDIFDLLDRQRTKITVGLTTLSKGLRSSLAQLNSLFPQVYQSIPHAQRQDLPTIESDKRHTND
jgi:hypothetical protein